MLLLVLVHAGSARAYTVFTDVDEKGRIAATKWPGSKLPIHTKIDPRAIPLDDGALLGDVVQAAMRRWEATPGSALAFEAPSGGTVYDAGTYTGIDSRGGEHTVLFDDSGAILTDMGLDPAVVLGLGLPWTEVFLTQGGARIAGPITAAMLVLNASATIRAEQGGRLWNHASVAFTAMHEIGHTLGLGHTGVVDATLDGTLPAMFFSAPDSVSIDAPPRDDDRAALASLYPGSSFELHWGVIAGTVVRSGGAGVFGASVTARRLDGALSFVGHMTGWHDGAGGSFRIVVPPGSYDLVVRPLDGASIARGVDGGVLGGIYTHLDSSFRARRFTAPIQVDPGTAASGITLGIDDGTQANARCVTGAQPFLPAFESDVEGYVPRRGPRGIDCASAIAQPACATAADCPAQTPKLVCHRGSGRCQPAGLACADAGDCGTDEPCIQGICGGPHSGCGCTSGGAEIPVLGIAALLAIWRMRNARRPRDLPHSVPPR